jgi:GDP-4-dehydro-6-deoxy-D-mannose reductase
MKKVLITGITGMAGSHLADYVLAHVKDAQVFGTKRWRSPMANVEHLNGQITLIDCDLTDSHGVQTMIESVKPDYIFHLAAQSFVPDSWANPQATLLNNVAMQLNLFEAVRRAGIDPKIQVALSSEEYGKVLESELPIRETNPLRPLSPYAVSKVTQDMLAYQYNQSYGLKVVRTRGFNHEGPRRGEVFVTSNFAKQIVEIELGLKPPVLMVGNLNAKRDWTDVRDMVRAYWLALEKCTPGEDYVICSGVTRTIQEMVDTLLTMSKVKIETKVDPARLRPSDVEVLWGDASKFSQATGWKTQFTFQQMMGDLLDYWREILIARQAAGATKELPASPAEVVIRASQAKQCAPNQH